MFSTHNLKLINPQVHQEPLCQALTSTPPQHAISSKTIRLSQYFWDESQPTTPSAYLNQINQQYSANKSVPPQTYRDTELTDSKINNLNIYIKSPQFGDQCSITPVPCLGLFHEMLQRQQNYPTPILSRQMVESVPERYAAHGALVNMRQGQLGSFKLPEFQVKAHTNAAPTERRYILLEFEMENFSIATGLVGVGLPSVSVFGLLLSNFLQRSTIASGDVGFAVGIHNIIYPEQASPSDTLSPRKAKIQGYLVFDCCSPHQENQLIRKLNTDFKISGCVLTHRMVTRTNVLPAAYWMRDMKHDVQQYLRQNPHSDALDAAFYFNPHMLCVPVSSGFALFDVPKPAKRVSHLTQKHSWAEAIFTLTELTYEYFSPRFIYRRVFNDGVLYWAQP